MTSNKLSKKDQDFADAMALKLRLNRESLAEKERERKLIADAGEFRMAIVRAAMKDHPGLTVEEALEMMDFFGA
tara:strand:+ start:1942 stop:2163 length:222 start_codon:yes stop_codon:yes gene_type:complete